MEPEFVHRHICFLMYKYRLEVGYRATKVFDSGWLEYFGGQGMYWFLWTEWDTVKFIKFQEHN